MVKIEDREILKATEEKDITYKGASIKVSAE